MLPFVGSLLAGATVMTASYLIAAERSPLRAGVAWLAVLAYAALLITRSGSVGVSNILVLAASAAAGSLLGRTLSQRGAIVTFCLTIALVDLFSFGGGLTRHLIETYRTGESDFLRFLAFSLDLGNGIRPLVGVGDLLILATLHTAFRRIGTPAATAAAALLGALAGALVVGLIIGGAPALPFLAAAAIGLAVSGHPRPRATPDAPTPPDHP